MDGILVVNKPAGYTSHDIVSKIRKQFNIKKVGHTGTLDPLATGVLPILLGNGTKLSQYLMTSLGILTGEDVLDSTPKRIASGLE